MYNIISEINTFNDNEKNQENKQLSILGVGGFMCEKCYKPILSHINIHELLTPIGKDYIERGLIFNVQCSECNHVTKWQDWPIDPNILPLISELNRKGYKTEYCCEGHIYEPNNQQSWIIFPYRIHGILRKYPLEYPWIIDEIFTSKNCGHRSRIITMGERYLSLIDRLYTLENWIKKLPIRKGSYYWKNCNIGCEIKNDY